MPSACELDARRPSQFAGDRLEVDALENAGNLAIPYGRQRPCPACMLTDEVPVAELSEATQGVTRCRKSERVVEG